MSPSTASGMFSNDDSQIYVPLRSGERNVGSFKTNETWTISLCVVHLMKFSIKPIIPDLLGDGQ